MSVLSALFGATQTVGDTLTGGLTKKVRDAQVKSSLKASDFVPTVSLPPTKAAALSPSSGAGSSSQRKSQTTLNATDFVKAPPAYTTKFQLNGQPVDHGFMPVIPHLENAKLKATTLPAPKGKLSPAEQWDRDFAAQHPLIPDQAPYGTIKPATSTMGQMELASKKAISDFWEKAHIAPLQILGAIPHAGEGEDLQLIKMSLDEGDVAGAQSLMEQYKKMQTNAANTSPVYGRKTDLIKADQAHPPGKVEKLFRGVVGSIPEFIAYTAPYSIAGVGVAAEELAAGAAKSLFPKAAGVVAKTGKFLAEEGIKNAPVSALFSAQRSKSAAEFPKNAAIDFATLFPLLAGGKVLQIGVGKGANAIMDLIGTAGEQKIGITPGALKEFLNGKADPEIQKVWDALPAPSRFTFLDSQIGEARLTMLKEKTSSKGIGENRPVGLRGPNPDPSASPANSGKVPEPTGTDTVPPTPDTLVQPTERTPLAASDVKIAENQAAVNSLMEALKGAESVRAKQETLYSKERSKRLGAAMEAGKMVSGEQGLRSQLNALKGELPKADFESLRGKVTQEHIDTLFNMIEDSEEVAGFQKINAKKGLAKMFGEIGGSVPTEGEIALLKKVFPEPLIDEMLKNRSLLEKLTAGATDILGVSRSIMASGDLSFGLRQGIVAAPSFPKEFASSFIKQFSWFKSETAFKATMKGVGQNKWFQLADEAGVSFTGMDSQLGLREEKFSSQLAERIPIMGRLVRASGRAYTGFANKFRMDIFASLMEDAISRGLNPEENMKLVKETASLVNDLTGRGSMGVAEGAAKFLNMGLFSPRLAASRINLIVPYKYVRAEPFVRQQYLKSMLAYVSAVTTVLGAAKLAGAQVGTDFRSADGGKIKIGNTRFEISGGVIPYFRMVTQLATKTYISSTTGKQYTLGEGYKPMTYYDIFMRQLESKESPIMSFITTMAKQQDYAGKPVTLQNEIISRLYPMMFNDLYQIAVDNPKLLPLGLVGPFGVSVQTYPPATKTSSRTSNSVRAPVRINPYRR